MSKITDLFKKSTETLQMTEDIQYVHERCLRKFPLLGTTMARLKTVVTEKVGGQAVETAGTDGKTIYISPSYFETLTDDEKTFVYAHEVMHVAFNHVLRSGDRDHKLWNQATDAVINQMLKSENLPMADGGVDIADAIHHSAEEMYEKLLREKEEKQKQKEQQKQDKKDKGEQSESDEGDSEEGKNEQAGHDNHEIWKEAVKEHMREERKKQEREQKKSRQQKPQPSTPESKPESPKPEKSDENTPHQPDGNTDQEQNVGDDGSDDREFDKWSPKSESEFERGFEEHNRDTKNQMAADTQRQLDVEKNRAMADAVADSTRSFGDVGKSDAALNWKSVLKKTLEVEEERWSYRRSDADNDYMARVMEMDEDDKGETEVLLDTSGSVSDAFLREFLRQLKPLLKNSKLRVGCFDHRFHPFVEIKTDRDIDNFKIPNKGDTDWDLAVKSFTKKKQINKIVFTDGKTPGKMPDQSTTGINIIWLVYGNESFNPICGRVIRVAAKQIEQSFLRGTPSKITGYNGR